MHIMRKLLHNAVIWIAIVESLLVIVMWCLGFRITYNPELDNNWDAISAVADWASVIIGAVIIPLAVMKIQHNWDSSKNDIALSNLVTVEQLNDFKSRFEPLLKEIIPDKETLEEPDKETARFNLSQQEQKLLQFLSVSMGANIKEISMYMNLTMATTNRLINKLKKEGKLEIFVTPRGRIYKVINDV